MPAPPLISHLPASSACAAEEVLGRFLEHVGDLGLELYPAQEEALLALYEDQNVILNTPTGSGKSLVATALHFRSMAQGTRSVYTCPIKALVNEKFRALCSDFGPENVGMATGDATVNRDAPILCCTAEVLANVALQRRRRGPVPRGDHGRIPLLRRHSARRRLAGAAAHDGALTVPPDVRHPRADGVFRARTDTAHWRPDGHRDVIDAAGATRILLRRAGARSHGASRSSPKERRRSTSSISPRTKPPSPRRT